MTSTILVPSGVSTIQAAENSIPANPAEPQIILIDGDAQQTYTESLDINGTTYTLINNLLIRKVSGSLRPIISQAAATSIAINDEFVTIQDIGTYGQSNAVRSFAANTLIKRCTIWNNGGGGGGCLLDEPGGEFRNCYIWVEGSSNGGLRIDVNGGAAKLRNCLIAGERNTPLVRIVGDTDGLVITNNIISTSRGDENLTFTTTTHDNATINYNKYLRDPADGTNIWDFGGTTYADTSDVFTGEGFEENSPSKGHFTGGFMPSIDEIEDLGVADSDITVDNDNKLREGIMDIGPRGFAAPAGIANGPVKSVIEGGTEKIIHAKIT